MRVDKEEYLIHLCRYIHLNPLKAGLVSRPEEWPYSNYLEWINKRDGTLKDEAFIKDHFTTIEEYELVVADNDREVEERTLIGKYVWD